MRSIVPVVVFFSLAAVGVASEGSDPWSLREIGEGLHCLEIDSTGTKCTIVEFDESLCLIEVALSARGGGATELAEHREGGEALLRLLEAEFPDKPLGRVLHSHWHPHSIASVAPFLERGIPLYTTRTNFERVHAFVDSSLVEERSDLIRYVERDTLVVGSGLQRVVIHRALREDYPSLPCEEYLFFHIPDHGALHCGCMYDKWRGGPVAGREILTTREQDLYRFISEAGLDLDGLIRVIAEEGEGGQILPFAGLRDVIENGVTIAELTEPYRRASAESLRATRDRIVRRALAEDIPGRLFNRLVYGALGDRDLDRAMEYALLQARIDPSNANAWDTLGEVHYFLGEIEAARAYEEHSKRIDPDYSAGGEEVWKKDLEDFRKRWAEKGE